MKLKQFRLCICNTSHDWNDRKKYNEAINEYLDAIDNRPNKKGNEYTPLLQKWTEKVVFEALTKDLHYELDKIKENHDNIFSNNNRSMLYT